LRFCASGTLDNWQLGLIKYERFSMRNRIQRINLKFSVINLVSISRLVFALSLVAQLLLWPLTDRAQAAAGDLDPAFGIGGKVVTDLGGTNDRCHSVALQSDGKIVVGGSFNSVDFALARYNSDGSLDPTFGIGGVVLADLGSQDETVNSIALQPDGKIVAAGQSFYSATKTDFTLARFNAEGSLDVSFGVGGKIATDFSGNFDAARSIAIQPDGRIVAAGFAGRTLAVLDFALARYNTDGSLDLSFGVGGKVVTPFNADGGQARDVAFQPDGKIVAAGVVSGVASSGDFALARYDAFGNLDPAFGLNGKVTTDFFNRFDEAFAIAVQPDGKIVAGGRGTGFVTNDDFVLARYNPDGSFDPSFGSNGRAFVDFSGGAELMRDIAVKPDGRIVAAGSTSSIINPNSNFALASFNRNGTLDFSFGVNGKLTTDFFGATDQIFGIAIQPDGKIVAAGNVEPSPTSARRDVALARYTDIRFDLCLRDDTSGVFIQVNMTTGEYLFTSCTGTTLGGVANVIKRDCNITLQHNATDRIVTAKVDTCKNRATGSIQSLSTGTTFTITDRDLTNNFCVCR
jgi:uncharacterized delta-60 repeat protein